MTAAEAAKLIDTFASLRIEDLTIDVRIMDVRESFGRTDYKIAPINGQGEQWVSADRVQTS